MELVAACELLSRGVPRWELCALIGAHFPSVCIYDFTRPEELETEVLNS